MIDDVSIAKYKFYLMEELVEKYSMNELEAQRIIANSTINKMLKTSPEYIMHYSIQDNAEEIYNEYVGIPMKM